VRPEWFDGAKVVGLTAGTSTPDDIIDGVEARIRLCEHASTFALRAAADRSAGEVRQVEAQIEATPRSVAGVAERLR
jgi:hypothetical protein